MAIDAHCKKCSEYLQSRQTHRFRSRKNELLFIVDFQSIFGSINSQAMIRFEYIFGRIETKKNGIDEDDDDDYENNIYDTIIANRRKQTMKMIESKV